MSTFIPLQPEALPTDIPSLIAYLDHEYPEFTPRTAEQVPAALARGSIRNLIDNLREKLRRLEEGNV